VFVLCVLAAVVSAASQRILSGVFTDNMVLQAAPNSAVLFGEHATPNSRIPIYLDGVLVAQPKADAKGKWTTRLAPVAASNTPRTLRVGQLTLSNVLFGNVFVCGGQEMAYPSEVSSNSNVRILRVTESVLDEQMRWIPFSAGGNDACLNMGIQAAKQTGLPVGLVQAVHNAPLASWFPITEKTRVADSIECSHCSYDQVAWDAVLSRIAPMRFRSFVWVGSDSKDERCVESKCVHNNLADGIRDKFTTNNLLIRTLKDDPFVIIGHRGMPSACPENTIVSQEVARRAGTQWIEDDTQPSKDNVPFVLHDSTVDRTTNGKGNIRDLTYAQLKALDAGSWFHPIFTGTRLPTLAEQLEDLATRGGNLLLEIKGSHSYNEVKDIIDLIKKYNMTKRVLVQSFDKPSLEHSYAIAPEIPIGLLCNVEDDPVSTCKKMHLAAYNPDFGSLTKRAEVIEQLHKIGVIIFTWTPDTATDWANMKKLGVDGIITNKATQLQGWVSAIKQMESYGVDNMADDVMSMNDSQEVFEGSDAKIVISSSLVASSRYTYPDSNVVVAPRNVNLAAIALQ